MDERNDDDKLEQAWENLRRDADQGREPQLIAGQFGQRQVSRQALVERIEHEFMAEYAGTDHLREADTTTKRLQLLRPVLEYVLAVESVQLEPEEKAGLIEVAYSNLFGYGPLDRLFLDETVTTISLEGADKAAVRHGHGDLESIGPIFEDEDHVRQVLRRLLLDAGADLYPELPFIETGLVVDGRPVGLSVITPVMSFGYSADIRVHPKQAPTLDDLVETGLLTEQAASLLSALARSNHGFVIVGDTEAGKTTLLNALLPLLPDADHLITVERAGELRLPQESTRLVVGWPSGPTFGDLIGTGLESDPTCIVLDEVRSDEPLSIGPLLESEHAPRQIWSFRGPFDDKRLRNALSMLARRANTGFGEAMVQAMYERLPFIVTLWRVNGRIQLYGVAEWQMRQSDYPDFVPLLHTIEGTLRLTGERPARELGLAESYWNS